MKDYRSCEPFAFSPRMAAVHAEVKPRVKEFRLREDTWCSPVEAGDRNPFADVFEEMPDAPYVIALAHGIVRSWLVTPRVILPGEALAGITRPIYPVHEHFSAGLRGQDSLVPKNPDDPAEAAHIEALKARMTPLGARHILDEADRLFGAEAFAAMSEDFLFAAGGYQGHTICNYPTLLTLGLDGVLEKIDCCAAAAAQDADTQNFFTACRIVVQGMSAWLEGYAAEAAALAAAESDPAQRGWYRAMAENCAFCAHQKPVTLYQAAQLMWCLCLWDWADCVGRMDQYLWPFWQHSAAAGDVISNEEVLTALMLRLWENGIHNITIGGVTPQGMDASNEISYLILQCLRVLHDVHPRVSVRVYENTPPALLALAAQLWSEGMSDPTVVGDKNVIEGLLAIGVPPEDARDYSLLGCQEIEIPGKGNWGCEDGLFNLAKVLEYTLYNGRSTSRPAVQVSPATGELENFADFEAFFAAYTDQLRYFIPKFLQLCDRGQEIRAACFAKLVKAPFTDGCLKKGISHDAGGPIYNFGVIETAGAAVTADSLTAIKKLVFEEKRIAPATLLAALRADFAGYEKERQLLLHAAPKFGNDNDEADAMAVRVLDFFWSEINKYKSVRGDVYVGACSLLESGTTMGKTMGAMPDGRRAGEPLGNSIGPRPGADTTGLTAMLSSVSKLPLQKGVGGTTLNVLLPTRLLAQPDTRAHMTQVLKAYLLRGGQMAQITTANLEDLKDARIHPERHGDLIVRVGGFSRQFIQFDADTQEEIISRYAL